jgi:hypothetical protein
MRRRSPHSFGLPLLGSLLLHAAFLGGLVAMSAQNSATPSGAIDTRTTSEASGLIVQLQPSVLKDNRPGTTLPHGALPDSQPSDFEARVIEAPIGKTASPGDVPAPVVVNPPSAPGGGIPAKAGSGAPGEPATGDGAGSVLFAPAPTAKSVVYVVDRSGSMGQQGAYGIACSEVVANLSRWPATTQFQIVPYNSGAEPLCISTSLGLLPIAPATIQKAKALLAALAPTGWTDHLCGLRRGLLLTPDVLYLVTDADDLKPEDVRTVTNLNHGRTVIHTIEIHARYGSKPTGALAQLAAKNGGTYRRVLLED